MKHTAVEKLEEIGSLVQFYEARGWDWSDPLLFLLYKNDGCPRDHWTLTIRR
jgi:hypothetical protein